MILNLLQPFQNTPSATSRLPSFASSDSSPQAVYDASVNQLKQLVLWAHLRYGDSLPIYVNAAFIILINGLLKANKSTSTFRQTSTERLYFDLCLKCISDLYVRFPLMVGMAQALLTMAVVSMNET